MARRGRSSEKEAFWRMVLQEFEASGLSVRKFCRNEGIAEPSFYGWRREIARRDATVNPATKNGLLPVRVVDAQPIEEPQPATGQIEIFTPGGLAVRVDISISADRLRDLLDALTQASQGAGQC